VSRYPEKAFPKPRMKEKQAALPAKRAQLSPIVHIQPVDALRAEHALHVHPQGTRPARDAPHAHLDALLVRGAHERTHARAGEHGQPVPRAEDVYERRRRERRECAGRERRGEVRVEEDVARVRRGDRGGGRVAGADDGEERLREARHAWDVGREQPGGAEGLERGVQVGERCGPVGLDVDEELEREPACGVRRRTPLNKEKKSTHVGRPSAEPLCASSSARSGSRYRLASVRSGRRSCASWPTSSWPSTSQMSASMEHAPAPSASNSGRACT
jgi:hypothetical protein